MASWHNFDGRRMHHFLSSPMGALRAAGAARQAPPALAIHWAQLCLLLPGILTSSLLCLMNCLHVYFRPQSSPRHGPLIYMLASVCAATAVKQDMLPITNAQTSLTPHLAPCTQSPQVTCMARGLSVCRRHIVAVSMMHVCALKDCAPGCPADTNVFCSQLLQLPHNGCSWTHDGLHCSFSNEGVLQISYWPTWEVVQGIGREIGPLAAPAQLGSPVWASWALRSARCQVPSSHEGHRQQPGYCAKTWYSYRRAVHTRMVLVKLPGLGTERHAP